MCADSSLSRGTHRAVGTGSVLIRWQATRCSPSTCPHLRWPGLAMSDAPGVSFGLGWGGSSQLPLMHCHLSCLHYCFRKRWRLPMPPHLPASWTRPLGGHGGAPPKRGTPPPHILPYPPDGPHSGDSRHWARGVIIWYCYFLFTMLSGKLNTLFNNTY